MKGTGSMAGAMAGEGLCAGGGQATNLGQTSMKGTGRVTSSEWRAAGV